MLKSFQNLIKGKKIIVNNVDYSDNIKIDFYLPICDFDSFNNNVLELFNGEKVLTFVKQDFCLYRC